MELTNKRVQYTIANADANIALAGEITIVDDTTISSFSGNLTKVSDSTGAGSFSYREIGDTCDQNLYSCPKDLTDEINLLIDSTVTAVKAQVIA